MTQSPGRSRQDAIYRAGLHGREPAVPTDFPTLERLARKKASARGWAYSAGGAGEGGGAPTRSRDGR